MNSHLSQVEWENFSKLKSISVVDDQIAWGVTTQKGKLWKTINGGENWQEIFIPSKHQLELVYFIDNKQGWIVDTQAQIMSTEDAGLSWKLLEKLKTADNDPSFIAPQKIQFVDKYNGWIADAFSIRKTRDGGKNWQPLFLSRDEKEIAPQAFDFVNEDTGYFCSIDGWLYKTTNGGKTWVKKNISDAKCNNLFFVNSNIGWIVTEDAIYQTSNGGNSWTNHQITKDKVIVLSVNFINSTEGWIAGYIPESGSFSPKYGQGVIFQTIDGGTSWNPIKVESAEKFFSTITFTDINKGWLFGRDYLYRTFDGGKTWQRYLIRESL